MENKQRRWWVSGLFSLVEPGLGQIYNGQARKGIIIMLLPLLLLPGLLLCLNSSKALIVCALLAIAYYIIVVGDAVSNARRLGPEYQLKKYNKIAVYIGVIVLASLINLTLKGWIRSNYVQAFKIPAASMVPTLLIGDHILVDRHMAARNPSRGDLIVFEYPEDPSKDFIKRVVAVAGDTVEIRNKVLFVNGKEVQEPYISHKEAVIIPASQNPRDNFGPQVISNNSYFVLGDNRDRSFDSRFWGSVTKDKVKGTVKNLYWSWDKEKFSVRWDRIGMKVM